MSPATRRFVVVAVGAALLMGLTAGPLSAAKPTKKTYSVTVDPTSVPYNPAGETENFSLVYTNTTPGGIASFNSLTLSSPAGFTIDPSTVNVTTSNGDTGFTVTTSTSAPNIAVTNLYPVSYDQSVTVTFSATVDMTSSTCSGAVGTWVTQAWTGANTSGDAFELSGPAPTTTIGTALNPGSSTTYVDANGNTVTVTNVGTTCTPITISRSGNTTTILKPTIAGVALMADIVWDPEPAPAAGSSLPVTEVDTPSPTHTMAWCGSTATTPPTPTMPTGEVSCLTSETSKIAGSNTVQVEDVIYLLGDISFVRSS